MLHSLPGDEPIPPAALRLLVRRYAATGREDLREALGPALARALDVVGSSVPAEEAAEWLMLIVEAATVTADDRLPVAAAALAATLRGQWPSRAGVDLAMRSLDACLTAAPLLADEGGALVSSAIDELERIIRLVYGPGEGLAQSLREPDGDRGGLAEHVSGASALLTAYGITGRLPYSMLAEELVQFARHAWWDDTGGRWKQADFLLGCAAVRVIARLAVLHADDDYPRAAVVAIGADYRDDAGRTLAGLGAEYRRHGIAAASYGLALDEWSVLNSQIPGSQIETS